MSRSSYACYALRRTLLSQSITAILGTAASAVALSPALAQEPAVEQVVVTGSRIVQRDFTANSPIVSVESGSFEGTSTLAVETVLNQLPQFVPEITQFSTTQVQPSPTVTPGANTISLRGLGSNRTLVLFDGRRSQPVNALLSVDTNTIPSAAIERVEVVTGGASATYGADAVAGVVNFILKKNFEGVDLDVQTGTTDVGDGTETRIAGLFGANFDEGRGNVLVGIEAANRDLAAQDGREFYDKRLTDPTMPGTNAFTTATYFSTVATNRPLQPLVNQIFDQAAAGSVSNVGPFYLNRDDTVYTGFGPSGDVDGAYRYTDGTLDGQRKVLSNGTIGENEPGYVSTPLERYSVFGRGRFGLTEKVEVYAQANFIQTSTKTAQQWSPAVGQWSAEIPHGLGIFAPSLNTNGTTNADYLPGGSKGLSCAPTGGCTNSQAFPVPVELALLLDSRPQPGATWTLNRTQDYLGGPRRTSNRGEMLQITTGATGAVDRIDGSWDVYFTYGETNSEQGLYGFGDLKNYQNIVTSANYGRGAVVLAPGVTAPNTGSGGTATCTTGLPIFDQFTISQDCFLAVVADAVDTTRIGQDIVEGTVQGRIAMMKAGELRFAAGASYRENDIEYHPNHLRDFNNSSTSTIGLFATRPAAGETSATDVFGELAVPLISGGKRIQEFSLELGARWSDYDQQGQATTWKALFNLELNDTFRFRGGLQRANRAPNVGELYLPESQMALATAYGDPCGTNTLAPWGANPAYNPSSSPDARAFCSQLMGPTGAATFYANPQTGAPFATVSPVQSGNPNLKSEVADTTTFGAVLSFDRINVTIDWYDIQIEDLIALLTYDIVYQQCMSFQYNPSQSTDNQYCQLIQRDQVTGGGGRTRTYFDNVGFYQTTGVDVQFNWSMDIGSTGQFGINTLTSFLGQYKTQDLPSAPLVDAKGTGAQGGQYDYRVFTTFNYSTGGFRTALRWRHYPSIEHATFVTNPATTTKGAADYDIFDWSGLFAFNERYEVRFGVDNVLDSPPEIYGATPVQSGQGLTLPSYYDALGRRAYVGFKVQF